MDGGTLNQMKDCDRTVVEGFTTNPSLMRALGVTDYEHFAREALSVADGLPVSLEVIADDLPNMERQARLIASWGENAVVKIPIMNTAGKSTCTMIANLAREKIKVNVTAVFTVEQAFDVTLELGNLPAIISVFAGRIADTGRDPEHAIREIKRELDPHQELLWASTREIFNYDMAMRSGADTITMTAEQIAKMTQLRRRPLSVFSRETVQMFYNDATKAGYEL